MNVPIPRYFRILVVAEDRAPVAEIIDRELGFRAVTVADAEQARAAGRGVRRTAGTAPGPTPAQGVYQEPEGDGVRFHTYW